jgi:hypothetical protein
MGYKLNKAAVEKDPLSSLLIRGKVIHLTCSHGTFLDSLYPELSQYLRYKIPVQTTSFVSSFFTPNYSSVFNHFNKVDEIHKKALVSGVVRGPLKSKEIKNLVVHPLGAVVQNRAGVSNDVCLVVDCSLVLNNVCRPPSLSLPTLKNVMD